MTMSSLSGEIATIQDERRRHETLIGLSRADLAARMLDLPERQARMRVR